MNRVWISGRIVDVPPGPAGQRLLLILTLEAVPKRILVRHDGRIPVQSGDLVETHGELGDQEPVIVGGQTVTTRDGRVAMRNVFHAQVMVRIDAAPQPPAVISGPRVDALAPTRDRPAPQASPPAKPLSKTEVSHVRGPELPWE